MKESQVAVEYVDISRIIPYEFNNKQHGELQIDRVANSISEFGWTQPIIIDEKNIILAGHKRFAAAKKLGLKNVPVIQKKDLTDAQRKAYRIIDNKTTEESPWDIGSLKIEMASLDEMDFDMTRFMEDFNFSLDDDEETELEEDEYDSASTQHCDVKVGDLIQLGDHLVLCGDSTKDKVADLDSIDLIITDPPYGVSYVGKTKDALTIDNDDLDEEGLAEFWSKVLDNVLPSLKEGGGYVRHWTIRSAGQRICERTSCARNSQADTCVAKGFNGAWPERLPLSARACALRMETRRSSLLRRRPNKDFDFRFRKTEAINRAPYNEACSSLGRADFKQYESRRKRVRSVFRIWNDANSVRATWPHLLRHRALSTVLSGHNRTIQKTVRADRKRICLLH